MVKNLSPHEIYLFIVNDFIGAWDSIAANPDPSIGRGNFMFARQAMNLVEFVALFCRNDKKIHCDFSETLFKIEPKYFTLLPSPCARTRDFLLPHKGDKSGRILLWALFDIIRHGLAHQYQQTLVDLCDQKHFYISLGRGADYGRCLTVASQSRSSNHLGYKIDQDGDLGLKLYPDILFLDIKNAFQELALFEHDIPFQYMSRGISRNHSFLPRANDKSSTKYYDFGIDSLEESLKIGNHKRL